MKISNQIKEYRLLNHLTQKRLGELLNVSDKTISSWENDRTYPDISLIVKLSEIFGLSLDVFLKGDTAMVKKIDRDLRLKKIYKCLLIFLGVVGLGMVIFLNSYQYKNQLIDRFNPFMEMEICYIAC
ncbi:helix-turn-helix transcriptional regulator [Enterococcus gilvus]|uniref:helix-turn-helix transcriptional regulator n=1 Tax=Enterococcus gilvus TaxID=160453 RepID=UPI003D6C33A0